MKITFDQNSPAWFDQYLRDEWIDQFHAYVQTQPCPEDRSHSDHLMTCAEQYFPPRGIGCRRVGMSLEFDLVETPELTMRLLRHIQ